WPDIADVGTIRVYGTAAQAWLIGGWLRSRLDRDDIAGEHVEAGRLRGSGLGRKPAPVPPGDPPAPSDGPSEEPPPFPRHPLSEAAVRAVAERGGAPGGPGSSMPRRAAASPSASGDGISSSGANPSLSAGTDISSTKDAKPPVVVETTQRAVSDSTRYVC